MENIYEYITRNRYEGDKYDAIDAAFMVADPSSHLLLILVLLLLVLLLVLWLGLISMCLSYYFDMLCFVGHTVL